MGSLERWSPLVFLLAGALLAVATVAIGFKLFTSMDGLTSGLAGLVGFIGSIESLDCVGIGR